jgi:methylmalonyl-CoA mutase C-terminal domain/subunit
LGQYDAFDDTLILVGGIIPDEDRADLFVEGVDEIFGPGVSLERIIEYVRDNVPER